MRRWIVGLTAVVALTAVVVAAGAFKRWTIADPAMRARVLANLEKASGLSATTAGAMTVRLLPRPTIEIRDVGLRGLDDAVVLDADAMRGRLALGALIAGQLQVSRAGFDNPTILLDLDRLQPVIGGLMGAEARSSMAMFHTDGLTLHGGVIRMRSRDHHRDGLLTELTATLEWPSDAAEASLVGSGTWRGITGTFGIDLASPAEALRGGQTLASAHLKSEALDIGVEGTVSDARGWQGAGKLNAATPDLPAFLRMIGMPTPQLDGIHAARLSGSVAIGGNTLSFDPAALDLDEMRFEGAVAVHERDGHPGLAATLATERIDLDPFLKALPVFLSPDGTWSNAPFGTRAVAFDDIDLRISATKVKIGAFAMEDGSLSLQSGDGRMELSIGEARAYDGLLKGRIVATLEGDETSIRADATLSRLDLKALLKDVRGSYRAEGTVSSHLALEARGTTPAELVRAMDGHAALNIRDGEIGATTLAAMVRAAPSANRPSAAMIAAGATPFDTATFALAVERGAASLDDSSISWPLLRATIDGVADLPEQTAALRAKIVPVEGDGGGNAGTAFDVTGSWHDLRLNAVRPHS